MEKLVVNSVTVHTYAIFTYLNVPLDICKIVGWKPALNIVLLLFLLL